MKESEINALLEKGYIKVRVIFEMLGKPKEHIEKTLKGYIENIKTDSNIEVIKEYFADAKEQDGDLWSTFAETEMLVNGMEKLTWLCVNFMPASIEVLEPESLTNTNKELSFWLNDVLSKLHEISLLTKGLVGKDKKLAVSMGTLLKNMVLIVLKQGPKNMDELAIVTGIRPDEVKRVVDFLVEQKKIVQDGDKYKKI